MTEIHAFDPDGTASPGAEAGVSAIMSTTLDPRVAAMVADTSTDTRAAVRVVMEERGWHASDHGILGDGTATDTAAFQAMLNAAADKGAGVILPAGMSIPLVQRVTVPSGTTIRGQGAVIRNRMTGPSDALLWVTGSDGVVIEDLVIDGERDSKPSASEWQHGINASGVKNLTIRNVVSRRNNGDGIYLGGTADSYCQNVTIHQVVCEDNVRQGMSVISVDGLAVSSSRFTGSSGMNPQAGVDFEPNTGDAPLRGITFTGCAFSGNARAGIDVAAFNGRTVMQGDITLLGCTLERNGGPGLRIVGVDGLRVIGGAIRENVGEGILSEAYMNTRADVSFTSMDVTGNGKAGLRMNSPISRLTLTDVKAYGNTTASPGPGVDLIPIAAAADVRIVSSVMGGATQTHGLRTNNQVAGLTLLGNRYPDVATSASLGDATELRTRIDAGVAAFGEWQGAELSAAPSPPSSLAGKLFFRDNGAGKTELCALFNSGSPIVIATQP